MRAFGPRNVSFCPRTSPCCPSGFLTSLLMSREGLPCCAPQEEPGACAGAETTLCSGSSVVSVPCAKCLGPVCAGSGPQVGRTESPCCSGTQKKPGEGLSCAAQDPVNMAQVRRLLCRPLATRAQPDWMGNTFTLRTRTEWPHPTGSPDCHGLIPYRQV